MAEPKRHMDVPQERVLERHPKANPPPKPTKKGTNIVPLANHEGKQSEDQISPSAAISM